MPGTHSRWGLSWQRCCRPQQRRPRPASSPELSAVRGARGHGQGCVNALVGRAQGPARPTMWRATPGRRRWRARSWQSARAAPAMPSSGAPAACWPAGGREGAPSAAVPEGPAVEAARMQAHTPSQMSLMQGGFRHSTDGRVSWLPKHIHAKHIHAKQHAEMTPHGDPSPKNADLRSYQSTDERRSYQSTDERRRKQSTNERRSNQSTIQR